ncbi:2OG-Fe(II) oxygenase family protein [Williamsia herbipolensis]|uniref:2OG-Fe(II) oxygenase family protein n=1 Tax=Williamsia herbipolensis TaxID=1603258 RepID=UPI0005F87921|nr:2OG-Fe(II) oxygenase family protein [Williamsia herbipolensis]
MTGTSLALQRGRVLDGALRFSTDGGLSQALRDGCFVLEAPSDFDPLPGVTLCREFFRASDEGAEETRRYRGYRDHEGLYFDREHFQTEHLLIDGPERRRHFPPELLSMTEQMSALTLVVLQAAMTELGIVRRLWSEITGGAVDGEGTHWFAANHYRSDRAQLGCAPHKDTGFVTVLYNEEPGLEASVDGRWVPIDPVPDHFIVNFGGAFELLTAALDRPVRAILHQVRQCKPEQGTDDRFSFAAFANPPADGTLYQARQDGSAVAVRTCADFLREFNEQTWSDRHVDFGIGQQAVTSSTEPL